VRIIIIALGKMKHGPERELVDRYLQRAVPLGKQLGISGFDIIELSESRAPPKPENPKRVEKFSMLLPKEQN